MTSEPLRKSPNDAAEVLRARARELARPQDAEPADAMLEVLEFRLGHERYALETRHVGEVYPFRDLTPLPATPVFVRGIVNIRGRIVGVLDLAKLIDLPSAGLTDMHRIILIAAHGLEVGLLADTVVGVRLLPRASLQLSLPTLDGVRAEFLKGITPDHLVVLDIDRLLADPRIVVNDDRNNGLEPEKRPL